MRRFFTLASIVLSFVSSAARPAAAQEVLAGELVQNDTVKGTHYGTDVCYSGSRAIVGAPEHAIPFAGDHGTAYLFERQPDASWLQVASLNASDGADLDEFGQAVALEGGVAIVGAPDADTAAGGNQGAAYIFERQANGTWPQIQKLVSGDSTANTLFGWSVAVSPNGLRAAVGAIDANDSLGGLHCGAVYLFERQGNGTWAFTAKVVAPDEATADEFGWRVALTDTRVFVSARADDDLGQQSGSVWVFAWPGSFLQKLHANDGATNDFFGQSMRVRGGRLIVGAALALAFKGAAYVFDDVGGTWTQVAKLTASDAHAGDQFGYACTVDGDRAVVGAPFVGGGTTFGQAYLFRRQANGTWTETSKFSASDGLTNSAVFGTACCLSGDRVVVGARNDYSAAGSVHAFRDAGAGYFLYGTGTPGCDGTQKTTTSVAEIGSATFSVRTTNAPTAGPGLALIGNAADLAGSNTLSLGILFHVSLLGSTFLQGVDMPGGDLNINSTATIPIPASPGLVGAQLYVQSIWHWPGPCAPVTNPAHLSSSSGAAFTILAP